MQNDAIRQPHPLAVLPEQWVVREYRPDYGIDLTAELFEYLDEEKTQAATLGETLYLQIKAKREVDVRELRVYPRRNVEVGPLREDQSKSAILEIVSLQLESSELLTVQAMGPAVPVLLLLVDISTERVWFVCLNDLVEKVILPSDPAYAAKGSKVVHIPVRNALSPMTAKAISILELYAKRPKLYAAFQKFRYQHHELLIALDRYRESPSAEDQDAAARTFLNLVRHFVDIDLRFDFWTRSSAWGAVRMSHVELSYLRDTLNALDGEQDGDVTRRFLLRQPLHRRDHDYYGALTPEEAEAHFFTEIAFIWHRLENLSGIYEEIIRECFLPTYLAGELTPDLRKGVE